MSLEITLTAGRPPDIDVKKFQMAVNRAVKRAGDLVRTQAVKETTAKYYVSSGDVKRAISSRQINTGTESRVEITAHGHRMNLSRYKFTPKRDSHGKFRGYKAGVKKTGGMKALSARTFYIKSMNLAFMRTGRGGRGFQNTRVLQGPSIPQILRNEQTLESLEQIAEEKFVERLNHELSRI